jgi:quercetin dioxygenase-like cupin family protein
MRGRRTEFVVGMAVGAALMAAVSSGSLRAAGGGIGQPPAAAAAETGSKGYTSKVVLENARVRVKDVTFAPGSLETPMHTHTLAHVGVILTPGSLVFTEPGKTPETVAFQTGSVGYREANVTHQGTNPGTAPMRVIEVELK